MLLSAVNHQLRQQNPTTVAAFLAILANTPFTAGARSKDLSEFLQMATAACQAPSAQQKRKAIDALSNIPLTSTAFPKLDMAKVVYDLVRRIMEPRLIGQGPYGLCGPATFSLLLAKTRPLDYANLAISLTRSGTGSINGLQIAPNDHVRGHKPHPNLDHGDWLIEASLRNSDDALTEGLSTAQYGGTNGLEMFDWAERSGYGAVVYLPTTRIMDSDPGMVSFLGLERVQAISSWALVRFHPSKPGFLDSFSSTDMTDPAANLHLASLFAGNGWKVLFVITEALANTRGDMDPIATRTNASLQAYQSLGLQPTQQQIDQARSGAVSTFVGSKRPNHWVLAKRIVVSGNQIRVTRYSYGTKETTSPVDKDLFFQIYGGFVAVNERDVFAASRDWDASRT